MNKVDLKSLSFSQLENFLKELSEPSFRAKQVFSWLYRGVTDFDKMSNLSKPFRESLNQKAVITVPEIKRKLVSEIDGTVKYLFSLSDGEFVETVVIKYNHGYSVCISSQVGCKMGCFFCASTIGGFVRNLTASEIIDQIIFAQKDLSVRISNVVIMGIGEPLDNFENILKFLENVTHKDGLNIGARHISLSTCGLVDKIKALADKKTQITLSVSLHAPNDEIRSKIMPVNLRYNMDELLEACRYYIDKTGRRISFEYTLIKGVNDSADYARELSKKLKGMLCHINLINVNTVSERSFKKGTRKDVQNFLNILLEEKLNATVRRVLGADINASCGQLRGSIKETKRDKDVSLCEEETYEGHRKN